MERQAQPDPAENLIGDQLHPRGVPDDIGGEDRDAQMIGEVAEAAGELIFPFGQGTRDFEKNFAGPEQR